MNLDIPLAIRSSINMGYSVSPRGETKGMRIKGRVVVVTGASRGIGQSAARDFARAGGRVAMLARSPEVLTLADEIMAAGGEARGYCVDLTDPVAFEKVARQIV